jgi:hypothetical protein
MVMSGGLLAAGLAALVLWRGVRTTEPESVEVIQAQMNFMFDDRLPSVWLYRAALAQSPESVDDLLHVQAMRTLAPDSNPLQPVLAARFNSELDTLIGEL